MFDDTIVDKQIGNAIRPNGMMAEKVKTCAWCFTIIYRSQKLIENKFCSIDCKEDFHDWTSLNNYRRQKVKQLKSYHENKKLKGKISQKPYTERKKAYYDANKEKIKKQMVAIRLKNKQNKKVDRLLDKKE